MNVNGRTPEQSKIPAGTITPYAKTMGNGKKRQVYRLQYNTMYFNYTSMAKAKAKLDAWIENGQTT